MIGDCTILDTHAASRIYFRILLDSIAAVTSAEDRVGIVEGLRCMHGEPREVQSYHPGSPEIPGLRSLAGPGNS